MPVIIAVSFFLISTMAVSAAFAYGYWVWSQWPLHHGRWSVVRMLTLWPLALVGIAILIVSILFVVDQSLGWDMLYGLSALSWLFWCIGAWIEAQLAIRACRRLRLPSVSDAFRIPTKNTIRRGLYLMLWLVLAGGLVETALSEYITEYGKYTPTDYIILCVSYTLGASLWFFLLVSLRRWRTGQWYWGPGGWLPRAAPSKQRIEQRLTIPADFYP